MQAYCHLASCANANCNKVPCYYVRFIRCHLKEAGLTSCHLKYLYFTVLFCFNWGENVFDLVSQKKKLCSLKKTLSVDIIRIFKHSHKELGNDYSLHHDTWFSSCWSIAEEDVFCELYYYYFFKNVKWWQVSFGQRCHHI